MTESDLLSLLCCPQDHSVLRLQVKESAETEVPGGELQCSACGNTFPIDSGIPRFLTAQQNQLSALQKTEMEARDNDYRASLNSQVDAWHAPEFDAIRAALGDSTGLSLLDAGCGVGKFNRAIRNAEHVLAIDFSWEALIRFQRPACASLGLVQSDITRMPIRDRVFDVALSCQVLSHLPTPDLRSQFLSELARVLKPGGRLILTAMHYSFRYRRRQIPQEAMKDGSFYHRFEVEEFRELLSERFRILSLHGYWIYLPKTYWLFRALGKKNAYWDRIWRSLPLSLTYGKYLLAVCSPKI
jgi:SAM-dependent methyltransferase